MLTTNKIKSTRLGSQTGHIHHLWWQECNYELLSSTILNLLKSHIYALVLKYSNLHSISLMQKKWWAQWEIVELTMSLWQTDAFKQEANHSQAASHKPIFTPLQVLHHRPFFRQLHRVTQEGRPNVGWITATRSWWWALSDIWPVWFSHGTNHNKLLTHCGFCFLCGMLAEVLLLLLAPFCRWLAGSPKLTQIWVVYGLPSERLFQQAKPFLFRQ